MDDRDFTVLHGLALRRRSDVASLERTTGVGRAAIEDTLARARQANRVVEIRGRHLLTPEGDAELAEAYSERFAELRTDPMLAAAYGGFEAVNRDLKALITAWQVRPLAGAKVPNDHSDAGYDASVMERLRAIHARAVDVLAPFFPRLPLVARHADRLEEALERAEAGEIEWVSGALCDSYHTVWYELHEDLLRLLGKTRTEEH